jgi:hypothetical protein
MSQTLTLMLIALAMTVGWFFVTLFVLFTFGDSWFVSMGLLMSILSMTGFVISFLTQGE